jgi:hypothetical protein
MFWQVRPSATSAVTLRGSNASAASSHCCASAVTSAVIRPPSAAAARDRHSLTPSRRSNLREARRLARCNNRK